MHQHNLEKYKDLQEQCVRNGWITIKVGNREFIINPTTTDLTNLELFTPKKKKYISKQKRSRIKPWLHQDEYGIPTEWSQTNKAWWYHEVELGSSKLVVRMPWPKNHAWTQSHHLTKPLLEAKLLFKQYSLYKLIILFKRYTHTHTHCGGSPCTMTLL